MFKLSCLWVLMTAIVGCTYQSNASVDLDKKNSLSDIGFSQCVSLPIHKNDLPQQVLIGTDVVELAVFDSSSELEERYEGDFGGASLRIDLSGIDRDLRVLRVYQEPGELPFTTEHKNLCVQNGYIYGDNVIGKVVKEGILWLELNSGNEFLTSDLWFHLDKK